MKVQIFIAFVLVILTAQVDCKVEYIKATYPHHTQHKYHVEKIPELKIETVPVEKEIKVLVPYKVPYEVKVPYIVQQKVHTHVEHKPVYSSHHIFHPPKKTHHHHHSFHSSPSIYSHPQHDDNKFYASSHSHPVAASDVSPLFISHHPVDHQHAASVFTPFLQESQHSQQTPNIPVMTKKYHADLNDFTSTLHTSAVDPQIGFGSHEGKDMSRQHFHMESDDEVGPVLFGGRKHRDVKLKKNEKAFYPVVGFLTQKSGQRGGLQYGFGPQEHHLNMDESTESE